MGQKLLNHLHLVLRLRMVDLYLHSSIRLHGAVLNYVSTGKSVLPIYYDGVSRVGTPLQGLFFHVKM
jgi:hypothetical protein